MKSRLLTAVWFASATLSVFGCAVTVHKPPVQDTRAVESGARSKVAYYYNLKGNCQVDGVPQVTVTKSPSNGALTIGAGNNLPQYPADNALSACNQQPVSSAELFYQSSPNFHGADDFAVQVRYSSSYTQSYAYNVMVN
jgi:hypothetical protein